MQRTEQTGVLHHSSLGHHCRGCPDQISCAAGLITGAGGLTISRSGHPFRTAYLRFILIEHRYSLHSDRNAHAACMNQCIVLFEGSVHSMCNDAWSRLADIIYSSQTEQAGCDEWQQNKDGAKCGYTVLEGSSTRLSFFSVLCLAYHFKWQTVSH